MAAVVTAALQHLSQLRAQGSDISVSAGTYVSGDSPKTPFYEPFLAIDPRDARNLLITSSVGVEGSFLSYLYASRDGGNTWQRVKPVPNNPVAEGGDAVVYFDASGTAFWGSYTQNGFLVSHSTDGGSAWTAPVNVPGGEIYDRPYLAFDSTDGKFSGRMYVGGTISVADVSGKTHLAIDIAYSTDGGGTFSSGRVVTDDWARRGDVGIADLLVTPEGKLVVPFAVVPQEHLPNSPRTSQLWTMVSEDGGVTFLPAQMGPLKTEAEGKRMLKSLVADRAVIDLSSGPYRGRIYLLWDDFDGRKYAVKVAHSSDLGKTWSRPIVVNDNTNGNDPANPAIAVNKAGLVGIVWNDRRDDPKNSCFRLYFTTSVDGGETFLPNVRVSDQTTCPEDPGNWAANAGSRIIEGQWTVDIVTVADRWPNGGDTQGLVAGADGIFHSAWINGESGVMQLWSKEITVDNRVAERLPRRKNLDGDLTLRVSEPNIDFATHTVSVKVRLENPSPVTVAGPFTVVLNEVGGSFKDLHSINSDNGVPGKGAAWNFSLKGKSSLKPHEESDERVVRWGFSSVSEEALAPVFAKFTILGQAQQ
jgi:hypothetical protein